MCVYVNVCTCIYVYIYTYIYVCINVHIYIHIYASAIFGCRFANRFNTCASSEPVSSAVRDTLCVAVPQFALPKHLCSV